MWVAVGKDSQGQSTILYSEDGKKWNEATGSFTPYQFFNGDVAYNPLDKLWVAVGRDINDDNGTILHSTDGKTWNKAASVPADTFVGGNASKIGKRGVAYSIRQRLWVVVGRVDDNDGEGTILHSTDGKNWNKAVSVPDNTFVNGTRADGHRVAYSTRQNLWVAVGKVDAGPTGTILHSTDGKTWSNAVTGGFAGNSGENVEYSSRQDLWVAVGKHSTDITGAILHSTDGKNWSNSVSVPTGFEGRGVAYSSKQDLWVAVGPGSNPTGTILHSTDGKNWSNAVTGGFSENIGKEVMYNPAQDLWVAVGLSSNPTGTILHSTDGKNWSNAVTGGFADTNGDTGNVGQGDGISTDIQESFKTGRSFLL